MKALFIVPVLFLGFIPPAQAADAAPAVVMCTMEAKQCPDGINYVSRSGPRCEFAPCPGEAPRCEKDEDCSALPKTHCVIKADEKTGTCEPIMETAP